MKKLSVCVICDREFDPKSWRHLKGKVNECGFCAEDIRKSIGVMVIDGKTDYHVEVLENPSLSQIKTVMKQQQCGPSQCHTSLGLNTNSANTSKDKLDSVQEKLDVESSEEKTKQRFKK